VKIIDQSYEIIPTIPLRDQLKLVEAAGRTAYKSEDLITPESAPRFVKMLKDRNHESVLEHTILSVRFVTDRGVSHELVRHRLASFTQESTRFCNYSKDKFGSELTFIRPVWADEFQIRSMTGAFFIWYQAVREAENFYFDLLHKDWTPQQARTVLPNSLKTEIVITTNWREWKHILQLRAISKAAHPQMRDLMTSLYGHLRKEVPEVFEIGDLE